jgi:hypothetical protein
MRRSFVGAVALAAACSGGAGPSAPAAGQVTGDVPAVAQPPAQPPPQPPAPPVAPVTPDPGPAASPAAPWGGTRIVEWPTWNDLDRVRILPGGGLLVVGSLYGFLAWLSPEGSLERTLSLAAAGESLEDVLVGADGTLWAGGYAQGAGGYLAHRDASGALLARFSLDGAGTTAVPFALAFAPGGDLVAAGDAGPGIDPSNPDGRGAWLARFDAAGKLRWQIQPTTDSGSYFSALAVAASGNLCVGGLVDDRTVAACFDAAGKLAWRLDLPTTMRAAPALVADPRGGVYLAGTTDKALPGTTAAGGFDAFVASIDGAGALRWIRTVATPDHDFAHGLAAHPAGGAVLVGHVTGADLPGVSAYGFVARLGADGALAWKTPIAIGGYSFTSGVTVDAAGEAVVVGSRQRSGTIARDGYVARLTADGVLR